MPLKVRPMPPKTRELQAKLLGASQESFNAGYATNLSLIEQQTYLAQAQTTEVMAKAAWLKAAVQLDRVLGGTLEKSGISLKADQDESRPATALIRQSIAQSLAIRLMDMWHLTRASETQDCQSTYRGTAAA
jgi:hypothetical protein